MFGLNDKDEHKQKIRTEDAKKTLFKCLYLAGIEGATLVDVQGVWNNETENTLQVILFDVKKSALVSFCENVKKELNQQAVAVEILKNVDVKFI